MGFVSVVILMFQVALVHSDKVPSDSNTTMSYEKRWFLSLKKKWTSEEASTSTPTPLSNLPNKNNPVQNDVLEYSDGYIFSKSLNRYVPVNELTKTNSNTNALQVVNPSERQSLQNDESKGNNGPLITYLGKDKNGTANNVVLDETATNLNSLQIVNHEEKKGLQGDFVTKENEAQCSHNYCLTVILLVSIANYYHNVTKF